MEANAAVSATLGMKNKFCVNVNVYFEIVHVRVRVRPYPPFPTTHHIYYMIMVGHHNQGWSDNLKMLYTMAAVYWLPSNHSLSKLLYIQLQNIINYLSLTEYCQSLCY